MALGVSAFDFVIVAHLGELSTMRRWFGGAKYGFSINHYLMGSFLLLICLPTTAAVTCRTCFDQIQGARAAIRARLLLQVIRST